MNSYRRFVPQAALIGSAAVISVFAWMMIEHKRCKKQANQKAVLDDWEDEGGSISAPTGTVT